MVQKKVRLLFNIPLRGHTLPLLRWWVAAVMDYFQLSLASFWDRGVSSSWRHDRFLVQVYGSLELPYPCFQKTTQMYLYLLDSSQHMALPQVVSVSYRDATVLH